MVKRDLIVIAGCSKRIGAYLLSRFKNSDFQLVGIDTFESKAPPENFHFIPINSLSSETITNAFDLIRSQYGNRITSFIHLGINRNYSEASLEKFSKEEIKIFLKNLKNFECEQYLFLSTLLVHSSCEIDQKINEDSPLYPQGEVPNSQLRCEELLQEELPNVSKIILRTAECYDGECHSLSLAKQIQRIYEKQFSSHVFPGDPSHGFPYLHFDDLAEAFWLSVKKRALLPLELILLVGEESTMSYEELQHELGRLILGQELITYEMPRWTAKVGDWFESHRMDNNYYLDITRARQVLGWMPKHHLRDSLPKIIQFLKTNPINFYLTNQLTIPSWLKRKNEEEKAYK